jgi:hypothetical protein
MARVGILLLTKSYFEFSQNPAVHHIFCLFFWLYTGNPRKYTTIIILIIIIIIIIIS